MQKRRSVKIATHRKQKAKAIQLGVFSLEHFLFAFTKLVLLVVGLLLFSALVSFAQAAQPSAGNKILVREIIGGETIELIKVNGSKDLVRAGQELRVGNKISTGNRIVAKLVLFDGSVFTLGQNSTFVIESRKADKSIGAQWNFKLLKGAIHGIVTKRQERKLANNKKRGIKIKLRTPSAAMGIRGTNFIFSFVPDSQRTEIHTTQGEVEFSKSINMEPEKTVIVRGGEWSYADAKMPKPRQPASFNFSTHIKEILIRHGFLPPEETKTDTPRELNPLHTIEECLLNEFKGWRYKENEDPRLGNCFE